MFYIFVAYHSNNLLKWGFWVFQIPTPTGKFECLDTAEAVIFYKVKGETKENVPTLPYGHHPSSQVNLGGFGLFRRRGSGGNDNLPPSNRCDKLLVKLLVYLDSLLHINSNH